MANSAKGLLKLCAAPAWWWLLCIAVAAQGNPPAARVVGLSGRAAFAGNGAPTFAPLRLNALLQPGHIIDTTAGGRVVLELGDGSQIVIHPNSRVTLKDFQNAGSLRELLDITLGRVRVKINHFGGRPNPYRLTSPAATIAVRGTDFLVSVAASGETQIVVYEGLVEVGSRFDARQRRLLGAGRSLIVRPGGDISLVTAGPSSELNLATKLTPAGYNPFQGFHAYDQYVQTLSRTQQALVPSRFAAFADSHADGLENPAYATEFEQAEGRLYLLPSLSRPAVLSASADRSL